ncbi:hypothetical protein [Paenibacillus sp. YIM B09110]|uniref:hypothetical protein n=1 Tax=Paenibacillus sp. YIM B09110 TaxID=3126102 RepID=UPI00301DBA31
MSIAMHPEYTFIASPQPIYFAIEPQNGSQRQTRSHYPFNRNSVQSPRRFLLPWHHYFLLVAFT